MNKEKKKGCSLGIFEVVAITLQTLFLTLKLIGTIDWSWWWVLAPAWIYAIITIIILITIYAVKSSQKDEVE